ncbi:MAG TPA: endoribonuclease MazF [Terriglobia bacterium]|nr:endoribonuclease MazF [Terriglobia bacterium]
MVARGYVPDAGDLIWLTFDPQAGREQAGRRPALVLSPQLYNERSGLALVCPVTSRVKGYPFEVALPENMRIGGVILADHLKSVDWKERRAEVVGRVPQEVLDEVLSRLSPLLGI